MITLLGLIAQAALDKGYDIKTSELHGLSQRGGSVSVHIRFGREVFSPMVPKGTADLILALESQEALAAAEFASKKTVFLVNKYQTPTLAAAIPEKQVESNLKRLTRKVFFISASALCQKELGSSVVAGVFLLGYTSAKKFIPLQIAALRRAIKETMPEKYWELNFKALELAKKYARS